MIKDGTVYKYARRAGSYLSYLNHNKVSWAQKTNDGIDKVIFKASRLFK
jgi:hypothetical protein